MWSLVLFVVSTAVIRTSATKYIDLTYTFNNETIFFPGRKSSFNIEFEGFTPNGLWVASRGFCTSEHTSTHIDAPYHFHQHGRTLDEIPLEDLIDIPGVMINVYDKVHQYTPEKKLSVIYNYVLTREDIQEWELINGLIPPKAVVLLRTGWGARYPNDAQYKGLKGDAAATSLADIDTLDLSKPFPMHFPGFDASAASFLVTERNVLGVGIDTMSIDVGTSADYPAHKIFSARNVYIIESVANLHLLPAKGFKLWMLPFKIDKGTGAPLRIIAKLDLNENKQ